MGSCNPDGDGGDGVDGEVGVGGLNEGYLGYVSGRRKV
jgi:hypothetical protein